MNNGNGKLKLTWRFAVTVFTVLTTIALVARWYMSYASTRADMSQRIETNTKEIKRNTRSIEDLCEKVDDQHEQEMPILIRLEEFYKLVYPESYKIAGKRADSVLRADSVKNDTKTLRSYQSDMLEGDNKRE